jgi:hypothetical protein
MCVNRDVQGGEDVVLVQTCDRREEVPVEAATENRRGDEHGPHLVAEGGQPPTNAAGKGKGDGRLPGGREDPRSMLMNQGPRGNGGGEELLHQERHALGSRRKVQNLGRSGIGVQTRANHVAEVVVADRRELDHRADPPRLEGPCQVMGP